MARKKTPWITALEERKSQLLADLQIKRSGPRG